MTVHVVLLLFISFVGVTVYWEKPYSRQKKRLFLLISFTAIFLIQALRGKSVGLDTDVYTFAFQSAMYGVVPRKWEFFSLLLLKVSTRISDNPQVFFALSSFLILSGLYVFIDQNVDDDVSAFWPVFLFVVLTQYFSTMNLIRQSLAMAVGCNIYTVLKKDRSKKGFIISAFMLCIATLFHTSGLVNILLVVPFLVKIDRKTILLGFVASLGIFFLYPLALRFFLLILPRYSRYIGGRLDIVGSSGVYVLFGILEVSMAILCFVFLDPDKSENKNVYRLLFIIVYSFSLIIMQKRISLAMRLGYYFELFMILLIPEFINKFEIQARVPIKITTYLLGWAYFIYSMTVSNARGCVPYSFFWQ